MTLRRRHQSTPGTGRPGYGKAENFGGLEAYRAWLWDSATPARVELRLRAIANQKLVKKAAR